MLYGLLCRLPPICIALVVHQTCFVGCRYKMVFFWTSITPDRSVRGAPSPNVRDKRGIDRTTQFGRRTPQPEQPTHQALQALFLLYMFYIRLLGIGLFAPSYSNPGSAPRASPKWRGRRRTTPLIHSEQKRERLPPPLDVLHSRRLSSATVCDDGRTQTLAQSLAAPSSRVPRPPPYLPAT